MKPEPTGVVFFDLKAQFAEIRAEIQAAVSRVLESQSFILGQEVQALEQEAAAYCQCEYAVGVSSGSDALLVALLALGIGPGDEVIVPTFTFFATAGSVARAGARPVFVDIDPETYNVDPASVTACITPRTRAIVPVHLFGQMADMDAIMQIAREHDLYVIEDAAQAIGAEANGRRAGSLGHMGCFSFFPTKNLGGAGDGGLITTNDAELAERLGILRNHGFRRKYCAEVLGGNFRLDALQAAVLRTKLRHLDRWTQMRQQNAATYRKLLAQQDRRLPNGRRWLAPPIELPGRRHVYNQFVVRVAAGEREPLIEWLTSQHVGSEIYYPIPMHRQPCFADLGYQAGDLPQGESACAEALALPIYPELTDTALRSVVDAIYGSQPRSKAA